MKTLSKEIKNRDGSVDTIMISSDDNYKVNLSNKYVLVGYAGNKYVDSFKNSILGMNIGINSYGFVKTTLIALLLVVAMIVGMYLSFRV